MARIGCEKCGSFIQNIGHIGYSHRIYLEECKNDNSTDIQPPFLVRPFAPIAYQLNIDFPQYVLYVNKTKQYFVVLNCSVKLEIQRL